MARRDNNMHGKAVALPATSPIKIDAMPANAATRCARPMVLSSRAIALRGPPAERTLSADIAPGMVSSVRLVLGKSGNPVDAARVAIRTTIEALGVFGAVYKPVALIAPAVFGANRALGNTRTALVCLAGHVIGSLVSEGILAYRIDAGQLSAANRHISDVGPSYVVLSAIVIALACGGWLVRTLAAVDLVVLVFPGQIFGGLSQLDVAAVGHLTAALTAAVATALILSRQSRNRSQTQTRSQSQTQTQSSSDRGSGGYVTDAHPDQVGDRDGAGA
jgi:hypothetical protein